MLANARITITDTSVVVTTAKKGVSVVLGETERGAVNTPVFVGSWYDYQRYFGGLTSTSNFPLYCKRALDGGAKLYIVRVAHYTDIADKSTLTGAAAASGLVFKAKNIGVWSNGLTVNVAAAVTQGKVSITVSLVGYTQFKETISGVNAVLTAGDIALINSSSNFINCSAAVGATLTPQSYMFTGGVDTASVVTADYIGSEATATGIAALGEIVDASYCAIPDKSLNVLDLALTAYCQSRGDLRPILRTPIGLSKDGIITYRQATAAYAGQAVDAWESMMFTGGVKVLHPTTNAVTEISEIGDVLARLAYKDNNGNVWDSFAGSQNGIIPNCVGVVRNFGSPAYETDGGVIVDNGVNPIIQHSQFGTVVWGNRSMLLDSTKMLFYAHVGDIVMYLRRAIKPITAAALFKPNDVITWRSLHNEITPILDGIKSGRGIVAYEYIGDQNADRIEDAVYNQRSDIDAGKYKALIRIQPTAKLEYIEIGVNVTNGTTSIEVLN